MLSMHKTQITLNKFWMTNLCNEYPHCVAMLCLNNLNYYG